MRSEWDKLTDNAAEELERREWQRRVTGRAPLGRKLVLIAILAVVAWVGVRVFS